MPAQLNVEMPDRLLESIRRAAAERGKPLGDMVVEILENAVTVPPAPHSAGCETATDPDEPIPDEQLAPHIIPDFWPESPGPRETVVPRDVGPTPLEFWFDEDKEVE